MTELRRSHPKRYLLIALPLGAVFAAVLAASLFVAGAYARYGLIRASTIEIEAPDQIQPGQVYDILIHAVGLPFEAGVDVSGDATQDRRGIEPIAPRWNNYRVVVPNEAGFYALPSAYMLSKKAIPSTARSLRRARSYGCPARNVPVPRSRSSARPDCGRVHSLKR